MASYRKPCRGLGQAEFLLGVQVYANERPIRRTSAEQPRPQLVLRDSRTRGPCEQTRLLGFSCGNNRSRDREFQAIALSRGHEGTDSPSHEGCRPLAGVAEATGGR